MKKRNLIIAAIIAVVVVAITLTGIFNPSAFETGAEGTIAKVSKYHKEQMNESDVLMRSKILSDTALLKETISGLVMFSAFSENLSTNLDKTVVSLKSSDLSGNQKLLNSMKELQEYSDFIKNNTTTLDNTIKILVDHYQTNTTTTSTDVEKKLEDFSNYVYQITAKDSILDSFIDNCDGYIADVEVFKEREKEIGNLKNVRDNLLLNSAQLAFIVGDTQKLNVITDKSIYNIDKLAMGQVGAANQLGALGEFNAMGQVGAANQLGALGEFNAIGQVGAANQLGALGEFNSNANNTLQSEQKLGDAILLQSLSSGIVICNKVTLQNALSKTGDLSGVFKSAEVGSCAAINSRLGSGYLAVDALKYNNAVVNNKEVLGAALNKNELSNVLKNDQQLGNFLRDQPLNIQIFNEGKLGVLNDKALGFCANTTLENVLSSQIGNMYGIRLGILGANQSLNAINNASLGNSDVLKMIESNISSMQAVLSSFPASLGITD